MIWVGGGGGAWLRGACNVQWCAVVCLWWGERGAQACTCSTIQGPKGWVGQGGTCQSAIPTLGPGDLGVVDKWRCLILTLSGRAGTAVRISMHLYPFLLESHAMPIPSYLHLLAHRVGKGISLESIGLRDHISRVC
jgi:hypothetical protein